MQPEQILEHALNVLENNGLAATTSFQLLTGDNHEDAARRWPDRDALLCAALRHHGQQIDQWRQQVLVNPHTTAEHKLLARYDVLSEHVQKGRYPGCLFIAACSFYPQPEHPVHQLAEQQKQASWQFTHQLLAQLAVDNPAMVADQLELILEGCLSKLLVKRNGQDVATARRLAEDVLHISRCRANGALT